MSRSLKAALVCIVIISIFCSVYLSALSLPSVAQSSNGSRIYGNILDKNGHGVDHADVKLIKSDGYALNIPNNPTYSGNGKDNPYGYYEFKSYPGNIVNGQPCVISAGTYEISASKDGHSASATVTVGADGNYSVDVTLSDYAQPSVTPVPTATPAPTPIHRASATVIPAPPTVIRPVVTPDANATAVPSASATAMASASVTVSPFPTAAAAANAPLASPLMGTFAIGAFAVLGTMALAIRARKN